jgi:FtsZ-binding cell division protein ZapB
MRHRYTLTLVLTVVCALLPGALPARLEAQVQHCIDRMRPLTDGLLQHAIDELKTKNPGLEFQPDEHPCPHARETISALSRTLGRNYLPSLSGHEFVKIINGEGYFTIERFKSRARIDLTKLEAALNRRTPHKLAVEANTSYEVFVGGETLVLMTSSGVAYDANSNLFHQIQRAF